MNTWLLKSAPVDGKEQGLLLTEYKTELGAENMLRQTPAPGAQVTAHDCPANHR